MASASPGARAFIRGRSKPLPYGFVRTTHVAVGRCLGAAAYEHAKQRGNAKKAKSPTMIRQNRAKLAPFGVVSRFYMLCVYISIIAIYTIHTPLFLYIFSKRKSSDILPKEAPCDNQFPTLLFIYVRAAKQRGKRRARVFENFFNFF